MDDKKMLDSYKLILYEKSSKIDFETFLKQIPKNYIGNIFKEKEHDTIGRSGGSPTWFSSYYFEDNNIVNRRVAIHKDYDYDEPMAAYAEKLWSILGKDILNKSCRVPDIDIVYSEDKNHPETISYRVLDNDIEDLTLMSIVLDIKFEQERKKMRDHCQIEELLDCIKLFVNNEDNYKEIEENVIHAILLDCMSNNSDRHPNNWGIVRNKLTNKYELALFDHSNSFRNLIIDCIGMGNAIWSPTYLKIDKNYRNNKYILGDMGKEITKYIQKSYPQYFNGFVNNLNEGLPKFISQINSERILQKEIKKIISILQLKQKYLNSIKERGEIDDE